jgi:hypothetical protein
VKRAPPGPAAGFDCSYFMFTQLLSAQDKLPHLPMMV